MGFSGQHQGQGGQAGQNSNPSTPRRSLEHPPGYQQNPYAAEMTSEQRAATNGGYIPGYRVGNQTPGTPGGGVMGGGGSHGGILGGGGGDESVWGMAAGWLKGVGKKAAEIEESVWKRVNGEN